MRISIFNNTVTNARKCFIMNSSRLINTRIKSNWARMFKQLLIYTENFKMLIFISPQKLWLLKEIQNKGIYQKQLEIN